MVKEKKRLLIYRVVSFLLLLLGSIVPLVMNSSPSTEVEIVGTKGQINNYNESLNKTDCEVLLVFNVEVDSGHITFAFYDDYGKVLSQEKRSIYYLNNNYKMYLFSFHIKGKVSSYTIVDYDIKASTMPFYLKNIFIFYTIFMFAFFISTFALSCKIYKYNDNEILIYAGMYHHYIKVNGIKMVEHNALISFTALPLSCVLDDGTNINATISLTNRISLKINNQIYKN